jgi:hypothetical protein
MIIDAHHMTVIAQCTNCSTGIKHSQSESWCLSCGAPLDEAITSRLAAVIAQRSAAALELTGGPSPPISRGERVFRGMLGMGMTFGAVGAALMVALGATALIMGVDRDDADFMVVAALGWTAISFAFGMLYGGLLAFLARGRSFKQLTIARVASAGAVVGLIPLAVVAIGSAIGPGTLSGDEIAATLTIFPPISAVIATATLLFARRAKPQLGDGEKA